MRVVAVHPASALGASRRLFDTLERAFPVRFEAWRGQQRCDALLVDGGTGPTDAPAGVPTLLMMGEPGAVRPQPVAIRAHASIDRRLRGLELDCLVGGAELVLRQGESVLASSPSGPVWTRAGATDRVRSSLPLLAPDEVLLHAFWAGRVLATVALVEMLRGVTAGDTYAPPPLRATLLFDDPNLRRRSYGYIRYPDLVRHADEHGYHASMAMIPLDAWGPHPSAATLFRERPDRVSLVVHGNDHRKRELFGQHDPVAALALGAQALRRVARFEAASGVRVGRVMVPPHGMCSQTMARALGRLPFDALCSIHPFPWTGIPPADELLAGWEPASFPEGCAVIPRLPFSSSESEIALRAYMDQPIVLYGHHEDIAEGLDVLAAAAARVNRLGDVKWMAPQAIALGNVGLRREGDALYVRPHARRVCVDERVATVAVEAPSQSLAGWSLGAAAEVHGFGAPVAVGAGPFDIRLRSHDEVDPASVPAPPLSIWPRLRRVATESRDRLAPLRRYAAPSVRSG
jgi:hypothetical protein